MAARRTLFAIVLASILPTACASTNCPTPEPFTIDESLTPEQLDEIVTDYGLLSRETIGCETACDYGYRRTNGRMEVASVDSCSFSLPMNPNGVAQVSCSGKADEGFCE
ncbi:hypothetical protein DB30_04274 [Enhygromyxa salina]|uniref:Lipoprotein n=1 Tax=Enhygromyxa salina TaxID=215803 RepID=A0A0C2D4N8_9BACT|nr:hypothetical protein [Enhygromyxa salina]KIG16655.1 hypothetical protein DB30_04274 [Enhygromyxa salina]